MAKRSTTGLPNVGVDLRVLDDDDHEVPWDAATIGEICVRSNHVMAGYWNAPDATADVLRGGWLRTGDLATVDDEGYVTIVDRRKDLIISGGENIASVEVEACLLEHPDVSEAAVVGMPDDQWGEVPRAFVTLIAGRDSSGEALIEFVAGAARALQSTQAGRHRRRASEGWNWQGAQERVEEPPAMSQPSSWTHTGYAQQLVFGADTVDQLGELVKGIGLRRRARDDDGGPLGIGGG